MNVFLLKSDHSKCIAGFTLSYLEKERQSSEGEDSADTQVLEKKEIRIQFDSPISHLNHIEPKLFLMAKEAVQALDKSVFDYLFFLFKI
jgi:hypothetical protein